MVMVKKDVIMKHVSFIFICLIGITACHKSQYSATESNGTQLTSIGSDSAGTLNFQYSNNLITSFKQTFSTQNGSNSTVDDPHSIIQYTNADSNQLISVTFIPNPTDYSINYLLSSSKLPLRIFNTYTENGIVQSSYLVKFMYSPNTDILDSVIYSYPHYADPLAGVVYKFTYSGQNITTITASQVSSTQKVVIATFDFTYGTAANVFRQTDPLLYIYSYPSSVFHAQPMVIAAFFAETFSRSTFESITTSGITSSGWQPNPITSKMEYHLNSNGKVTAETFSNPVFEFLAGKKYIYE